LGFTFAQSRKSATLFVKHILRQLTFQFNKIVIKFSFTFLSWWISCSFQRHEVSCIHSFFYKKFDFYENGTDINDFFNFLWYVMFDFDNLNTILNVTHIQWLFEKRIVDNFLICFFLEKIQKENKNKFILLRSKK
jgi:hypothetical protein